MSECSVVATADHQGWLPLCPVCPDSIAKGRVNKSWMLNSRDAVELTGADNSTIVISTHPRHRSGMTSNVRQKAPTNNSN